MSDDRFQVVCDIEPPALPDLMHVRHQIGTLSKAADVFLIPDNHLGRATVSSVAVAHEVEAMGVRSIACLNSRRGTARTRGASPGRSAARGAPDAAPRSGAALI
jgi:hypothetical protein